MAVVLRIASDTLGRPGYARLMRALDLDANPPPGQLLHLASETAAGTVVVVELWQTPEAATAFVERRLGPALLEAGVEDARFEVQQSLGVFTPDVDTLERIGVFAGPSPVLGAGR